MRPRPTALLAIALVTAIGGCRKRQGQEPPAAPDAKPDVAPPESLQGPQFRFAIGVYHLSRPPRPVGPTLARLVHGQRFLTLVNAPADGPPDKPIVALVRPPLRELPPPSPLALAQVGRGLSPEQIRAVRRSDSVSVLLFAGPSQQAVASYRRALDLVSALAEASPSLIWDEEARLMYAPAAWQERRQTWTPDGIPDVRRHIAIHAFKDGDELRMVTLGMRRFALPDVVVNRLATGHEAMNVVISLLCQRLVEGAVREPGGKLVLALDDIKHPAVRSSPPVAPNARRQTTLTLAPIDRQSGDPDNQLLEITFSILASERHEQQAAVLSELFGDKGAGEKR